MPALALDVEDAGGAAAAHCECGGFSVERRAAVDPKGIYAGRHDPCPDDMRYNCPIYRMEYLVTPVCNRCGAALGDSYLDYELETRHLH